MMRRPGQQVKSLPVIYVIAAFLAWHIGKAVPHPSMIVKRRAIRRQYLDRSRSW
jgi:hypothetical protein